MTRAQSGRARLAAVHLATRRLHRVQSVNDVVERLLETRQVLHGAAERFCDRRLLAADVLTLGLPLRDFLPHARDLEAQAVVLLLDRLRLRPPSIAIFEQPG